MSTTRIFYPVLGCAVGPSPSTGYQFNTGFNNVYTGANSGNNLIQPLTRLQSVNDSWNQPRQNVGQLGQIAIIAQVINEPPNVQIEMSWNVADMSNERILGFYTSGNSSAIANIINLSQADKNYFIAIAPPGQDQIGWTGQSQVKVITNGFLSSYSTEGAVGAIPTTTVSAQGFNWQTTTGSFNQPLLAVDFVNNVLTTGLTFTLPVFSSGLVGAVPAVRPSEIFLNIGNNTIGLATGDLKLQRYNLAFNLNPQKLTKLGAFFPYSLQPTFPVEVTASVTAYWGDLVTGSLSSLSCNDQETNVSIVLRQPSCLGQAPGSVAASWTLLGAKLESQSFSEAYSDVASTVTLNFKSTLGGPGDVQHNLLMSGINI